MRGICQRLGLDSLIDQKGFAYQLKTDDNLSGGQLTMIELARTLLMQRPILLLDEINSSLDQKTSTQLHHFLLNSNLTFLEIIHHYLPGDLKKYDHVIDLKHYLPTLE